MAANAALESYIDTLHCLLAMISSRNASFVSAIFSHVPFSHFQFPTASPMVMVMRPLVD